MRAVASGSSLLTIRLSCSTSRNMRMFLGPQLNRGRTGRGGGRQDLWKDAWLGKSNPLETDRFAVAKLPPRDLLVNSFEKPSAEPLDVPVPKEIVAYLDQFVIGQELAKMTLAVGVYQHYKRFDFNFNHEEEARLNVAMATVIQRKERAHHRSTKDEELKQPKGFILNEDPEADIVMDKSNIILLGPSGSGKTYLTKKLAEALDVPIALCDCTTLTQAGYVGDDVESVVQKLLVNANGNVVDTERGIVFLDEFDKIYTSSDPSHTAGNRDVNGKGVQQALLKLVEGTKCLVKNPLVPNQKVEIDTGNVLFIASGAFAGLDSIVAKRLDRRTLGFNAQGHNLKEALDSKDQKEAALARSRLNAEADSNDLIQFGMVPELVGRFPVLVPFEHLSEQQLHDVLVKPRNNIIDQHKALFKLDGIELEFTDCAMVEIARQAVRRKTGARALRSILEKVLLQAKYECPGAGACTVVITGAVVRGEATYQRAETRANSTKEAQKK